MILSCGECLIDMLPRRSEAGEDCFAPYPGGALFNTAIALGRIGFDTGFVSGISNDLFGQMLTDKLDEAGVSTDLSIRSDRPTTLAFVRLTGGQASYTFYDENSALRMLTAADVPTVPDAVKALVFGCISLVGEPCAEFFEALMMQEADARVILLDPNIRAGFVTNEAGYRARLDRMMARADIVKLSDEDLHWLMGEGDIADLAGAILDKGAKVVCVTQGADGVAGFTRDFNVFAPATKVDVVDTVGAGDTINAGILAALDHAGALSKDGVANLTAEWLQSALAFAARAAAITVSRAGANPPWAHEL